MASTLDCHPGSRLGEYDNIAKFCEQLLPYHPTTTVQNGMPTPTVQNTEISSSLLGAGLHKSIYQGAHESDPRRQFDLNNLRSSFSAWRTQLAQDNIFFRKKRIASPASPTTTTALERFYYLLHELINKTPSTTTTTTTTTIAPTGSSSGSAAELAVGEFIDILIEKAIQFATYGKPIKLTPVIEDRYCYNIEYEPPTTTTEPPLPLLLRFCTRRRGYCIRLEIYREMAAAPPNSDTATEGLYSFTSDIYLKCLPRQMKDVEFVNMNPLTLISLIWQEIDSQP